MLHQIHTRYLLMVGEMEDPRYAKTAFGLRDWVPEKCVGQLRLTREAVDLGLPEMSPAEAVAAGARTLIIGIAPPGGALPASWSSVLAAALEAGLDLAAGLHQRLADIPQLRDRAAELGRRIHDVRHSDVRFPVGTGLRRPGRRLLTVGTDCALGKKYTALAIAKALREKGVHADFRATGQTGILISGYGVAVDAVVGDFISGAAETLSPGNAPDHWDIIEGQGSLFHPAYAGVCLGLLHGSQPDALVLCHDPQRKFLSGFPHFPLPSPAQAIEGYLSAASVTNPEAEFVGVSLNTAAMTAKDAEAVLERTSRDLGLPSVDPIRTGVGPIVSGLERFHAG
jgi:uncharacterized NAD-dependent epimerase/dehydratase family protein